MSRTQLLNDVSQKFGCISRSFGALSGVPIGGAAVSKPEAETLLWLATQTEGASLKALAEAFNVTNGAASQVVELLVQKKLVVRSVNPADRRGVVLVVAPTILAAITTFRQHYIDSIANRFEQLSDQELTHLLQLLSKIVLKPSATCSTDQK